MSSLGDASRRIVRGRRIRSDQLRQPRLSRSIAGPIYGSDAVSSLAYSPDQILLTLALAGTLAYGFAVPVALVVAAVLIVVAISYRLTLREYPTSGGDYEVTRLNLGKNASLLVAGAVLVDYVLVVSVSVSAAAFYAGTLVEWVDGRETLVATLTVVVLTVVALRGFAPRGILGAIPAYLFVAAVTGTVIWGWIQVAMGDPPVAQSADYLVTPAEDFSGGLEGIAVGLLVLRAFSVGAVSLTGVQTIASAVPRFKAPRSTNASSALTRVAVAGALLLVGVVALARTMNVQVVEDVSQLTIDGAPAPAGFKQNPVLEQLASGVMVDVPGAFSLVAISAIAVLLVAAVVTYEAFPGLASVLARDGFLPRQMHLRGDRLTFSVGIAFLAVASIAVIVAFDADVIRLVHLYVVGVFIAFTLSQAGMVKHWSTQLAVERRDDERARLRRGRAVSAVGASITGVVLAVLLVTKLGRGAWLTLLLIGLAVAVMSVVKRHYVQVAQETQAVGGREEMALPSRVHAIVLASRIDKPTMRAISYARGTGATVLEAVTVDVSPEQTRDMVDRWSELQVPVPLRVLDSPYREITRPIAAYVNGIRTERPRDVVVVYIPELVVRRWWERLLHNHSADALRAALMTTPGVMITSVPWVSRRASDYPEP